MDVTTVILWVLLLVGAASLLFEVIVLPGFGFFGIAGIVMLLSSFVMTAWFIPYGIFVVFGEIAGISALLYFMLKYIKKKQLYGKIILDETLNREEREIADYSFFMGKEGLTKTPLRPFGNVVFNGETLEVCSDGKFISENKRVKVVDIKSDKIIVTELLNGQ